MKHETIWRKLYCYDVTNADTEPLLFVALYAVGEPLDVIGVFDPRMTRETCEAIVHTWEAFRAPQAWAILATLFEYRISWGSKRCLQIVESEPQEND
jgi:hypothetical protein